jgi:hypothetical protein
MTFRQTENTTHRGSENCRANMARKRSQPSGQQRNFFILIYDYFSSTESERVRIVFDPGP